MAYFIGAFWAEAEAGIRALSPAPNSRRVITMGHYPTCRSLVEYLLATTTLPPVPWLRWAIVLTPGLLLYFVPIPGLVAMQSHLLAIFVACIIGLVAQPVPMGVTIVVAMTLLTLTGTLPPA